MPISRYASNYPFVMRIYDDGSFCVNIPANDEFQINVLQLKRWQAILPLKCHQLLKFVVIECNFFFKL